MNDVSLAVPSQPSERPQSVEGRLLARYADGDDSAMDELMLQFHEQAFWVARHIVHHDEMAQDVVQDAFVRLIRHHHRFDDQRSSFRAWFLQIVRNMAIDHLRKARVRVSQDLVDRADQSDGPVRIEQEELRERIRTVIEDVPESYRELLIMRDVEGLSPQDIAEMIGVEYGTTRWRIHNARKLFRQAWKKRYGEDPV